ncbi:ketosynthase chain-length factor [Dactylosporangium sp. NPDC049140]|jgi:act minimal PKS chain-length factor (CLF/KS beta)|uniref:ketosynthase chain-length factor n=1 Tax=Dactylosporangium sp. NPDC049140 TaxID=3155647 RepID=UPI0033E68626
MSADAVFTGLGIVAPTGVGHERYWAATLEGRDGIAPITRFDPGGFPVGVAGQVAAFTAEEGVPGRLAVQTDRWTHLAFGGAELALRDAGADLAELPDYELAVITASSSGGNEFGQQEIQKLWGQGPQFVGVYQSIAWFYAATTGQLSIRHGLRGPCGVRVTEQAGGLDAIADARRALRTGSRLVLTGGTEAPLSPYALVCQGASGLLSGDGRYRPFDPAAAGYVPGEGGAILVLESAAAAAERGARVYGRLAGYGATFDPAPGSARPPGLRRAIELALADAGLDPGDIGVVFADAHGAPEPDRREAEALRAVFGPRGVPVTAPKSMTGRLYAGGSALDTATALLALRDGVIPPTTGTSAPAGDYELDLVLGAARPAPLRHALVVARGFGGFNAALVLSRDFAV